MSKASDLKFTDDQVGAAMSVLAEALKDLPGPQPAFDEGRIDYLIPDTLRSRAEAAVQAIMTMGALAALDTVFERKLREAVAAERERILKQVRDALSC